MKPVLYDSSERIYRDNGIGRLSDCITCEVEQSTTSEYTLTLEYPIAGAHAEDLVVENIITAMPETDASRQAFRIAEVEKTAEGIITVKANHISYDLLKRQVLTGPGMIVQPGAAAAMEAIGLHVIPRSTLDEFSFETDIESTAQWKPNKMPPGSVREMLGGREGSILDTFGGQFEWDNYRVILHKQRGVDNGVRIEYGKNMTDMNDETDSSGAYGCVFPFYYKEGANIRITSGAVTWKAGDMLYLADQEDPVLPIPGATVEGCAAMDLTEFFDDPPTSFAALRSMALQKLPGYRGVPAQSTKAKFIPLWQTVEYADLNGQEVHLYDIVRIKYPGMHVDVMAVVTKTNFNVLTEKYNSIEVGTSSSLFDTISDMIGDATKSTAQMTEDRVAEFGTSGNWTYRRWISGRREAWFRGSVNTGSTWTATGNVYRASWSTTIPSDVGFESTPKTMITLGASAQNVFTVNGGASSKTAVSGYAFRGGSASSASSLTISIYAWTD